MMNKLFSVLVVIFLSLQPLYCQTVTLQGKPVTEIYTDFHYNINDTTKTTGFGINRALFGYEFTPGGDFTARIVLNIGSPEDLSSGAMHRRYAHFREACFSYTKDKLKLSFGITATRIFEFQQKFWGKRYLANNYQSENEYGYIADLGLVADYKFSDVVKGDITIMNGEGYSELQIDNSLRTSIGLTITPGNKLAFRVYADISKPLGIMQNTLIGFAGFKNDLITIGGEVSYKSNLDRVDGHHAWGLSGTGGVNLTPKTELFMRYDHSASVIPAGEIFQWNNTMDGDFMITGVQYTFNQYTRFAINYRVTDPYDISRQNTDAIYINAHFRF
jgi:hypothetical protein